MTEQYKRYRTRGSVSSTRFNEVWGAGEGCPLRLGAHSRRLDGRGFAVALATHRATCPAKAGMINTKANMKVVHETPTRSDADNGWASSPPAGDGIAIEKAEKVALALRCN